MASGLSIRLPLQHGTADPLVPHPRSAAFAAEARRDLGPAAFTLDLLPGAGHDGPAFRAPANVARDLGRTGGTPP